MFVYTCLLLLLLSTFWQQIYLSLANWEILLFLPNLPNIFELDSKMCNLDKKHALQEDQEYFFL